ncbi:MAG TPA: hypothetical protein PLH46_06505 [Caldisericia bacterium]|nr:hypothetical protein [Caldisericia bacterium]
MPIGYYKNDSGKICKPESFEDCPEDVELYYNEFLGKSDWFFIHSGFDQVRFYYTKEKFKEYLEFTFRNSIVYHKEQMEFHKDYIKFFEDKIQNLEKELE